MMNIFDRFAYWWERDAEDWQALVALPLLVLVTIVYPFVLIHRELRDEEQYERSLSVELVQPESETE